MGCSRRHRRPLAHDRPPGWRAPPAAARQAQLPPKTATMTTAPTKAFRRSLRAAVHRRDGPRAGVRSQRLPRRFTPTGCAQAYAARRRVAVGDRGGLIDTRASGGATATTRSPSAPRWPLRPKVRALVLPRQPGGRWAALDAAWHAARRRADGKPCGRLTPGTMACSAAYALACAADAIHLTADGVVGYRHHRHRLRPRRGQQATCGPNEGRPLQHPQDRPQFPDVPHHGRLCRPCVRAQSTSSPDVLRVGGRAPPCDGRPAAQGRQRSGADAVTRGVADRVRHSPTPSTPRPPWPADPTGTIRRTPTPPRVSRPPPDPPPALDEERRGDHATVATLRCARGQVDTSPRTSQPCASSSPTATPPPLAPPVRPSSISTSSAAR